MAELQVGVYIPFVATAFFLYALVYVENLREVQIDLPSSRF